MVEHLHELVVRVDEHWHLASFFPEVLDDFCDGLFCLLDPGFSQTCSAYLNDNPELVVGYCSL